MTDSFTPPIIAKPRTGNLSQEICKHFEFLIKSGQLAPQEKLPSESEIMTAHGVSRTVVREALSQLQARNHVQTRQGIGTFVLPKTTPTSTQFPLAETQQDVVSVMEVRISLESECAALAAQRRTPTQLAEMRQLLDTLTTHTTSSIPSQELDQQLHVLITQATSNRYMIEVLSRFSGVLIPRMRLNSKYLESGRSTHFLQRRDAEHEEIFSAISRQDATAASAAMRLHLSNSRERLLEICSTNPS